MGLQQKAAISNGIYLKNMDERKALIDEKSPPKNYRE